MSTRGVIPHMDDSKQVCYKDRVRLPELIAAIKAAMDKQGMTATALAEAVGVAPQSLGRWLNGKHAPSVENLEALARAVGLEVHLRGNKSLQTKQV